MKITLSESQFASLILQEMVSEYNIADGNANHNPYFKKVSEHKKMLEELINQYGKVMINIQNGKEYSIYEIYSLSEILGHRYVICRLIKDNEPYGQVSVKPLVLFKDKNY